MPDPPPPPPWHTPTCDSVGGAPIATYSPDRGVTVKPIDRALQSSSMAQTGRMAAAGEVAVLYAVHGMDIYISRDAGCSWELAYAETSGVRGFAATEWHGYAIARMSATSSVDRLLVFNPDGLVAERDMPPGGLSMHLTAAPSDPGAVYMVTVGASREGGSRQLWRSGDQGRSWEEISSESTTPTFTNQLAINPRNSLHIIASRSTAMPTMVSFDGGSTWMESEGIDIGQTSGRTGAVVFGGDELTEEFWVIGRRTYWNEDGNVTEEHRFLARSTDGGLTFDDVIQSPGSGIRFSSQARIVAPPGVVGELLIGIINCPLHPPQLYHYRLSDDSLTILQHDGHPYDFHALQFNPVDPDVLYMGLVAVHSCPQ